MPVFRLLTSFFELDAIVSLSVFQQDGGHAIAGLRQQPPAPPELEATEEAR